VYAFDITDAHDSEYPQLSPVSTDCLPWLHVSGTLTKIREHLMMIGFWRVWGCGEDECRMQAYGFARRFDLDDGEEKQYVNLCCVVTDL
jgi:hypothetical protein